MTDANSTHGKLVTVRDVMHQDYSLVNGFITVADALQQMRRDRNHVLIIDKLDEHDEYGLVLVADIAKKVLANNRAPERVNLYEIMSKPALAVSPEMQIRFCARLFAQFGLSIAPVVGTHASIEGIVSYENLVLDGLLAGQLSTELR